MSKRNVWISRDNDPMWDEINMWHYKPLLDDSCAFQGGDTIKYFCAKEFKKITGFNLKRGECKCVTITVEEVEEKA